MIARLKARRVGNAVTLPPTDAKSVQTARPNSPLTSTHKLYHPRRCSKSGRLYAQTAAEECRTCRNPRIPLERRRQRRSLQDPASSEWPIRILRLQSLVTSFSQIMLPPSAGEFSVVLEFLGSMVSAADCAFHLAIRWILVHTPSLEDIASKQ